jgi:hypothetical protein
VKPSVNSEVNWCQALASTGAALSNKRASHGNLGTASPLLQRLLSDVTSPEVNPRQRIDAFVAVGKWAVLAQPELQCLLSWHRNPSATHLDMRRWLALQIVCSVFWTKRQPATMTSCTCSLMRSDFQMYSRRYANTTQTLLTHYATCCRSCPIDGFLISTCSQVTSYVMAMR